jgi:hypothetical protein
MKNTILLIAAFVFSINTKAQDIITTLTGEELKSKVIEITTFEIKYKKIENINGPIYNILKSDVFMVKYENGSKDIFTVLKNNPTFNYSNVKTKNNPILICAGIGLGASRIENIIHIYNGYDVKFKPTSQLSLLFYYDLSKSLSVQSGISTLFSRYSITQNYNGYNYVNEPTLMFVNMPINLNYKFKFSNYKIGCFAGPNLCYGGWSFSKGIFNKGDKVNYNVLDLGFNVGINYKVSKNYLLKFQYTYDAFNRELPNYTYNGTKYYYVTYDNMSDLVGKRKFVLFTLEFKLNN